VRAAASHYILRMPDFGNRSVHLLIFDGLADWEPSYALTGLRHWAKVPVRTVGFDESEVMSMAGLRILPDTTLGDVDIADVALFMLPGGDMWEAEYPRDAVDNALANLARHRIPIAGICAATIPLARAGLFANRRHTSNGRDYLLKHVPSYAGSDSYVEAGAIRDKGVVSATGLAALDFAREVFAELDAFTDAEIKEWYDMYHAGRIPSASKAHT
jgi:putative intracellular protease/amidase